MTNSKTTVWVLVCFAVAFVIGVLGWLATETSGATRDESAASNANGPASVPARERTTDEPLIVDERSGERIALDPRDDVGADEPSTSPRTSDSFAVRVVADGAPWITEVSLGAVDWSCGATATYPIFDEVVELPRAPTSIEQFGVIQLVGLAGSLRAFRALDSAGDRHAPAFELRAELVPGALLDWSSSVPVAERMPVTVGFGRALAGESDMPLNFEVPFSLVCRVDDVALPLRLPRVAQPTTVWVDGSGRAARAFHVTPDTRRIDVALESAAALRVFHDGEFGSEVVACAVALREEKGAMIRSAAAVELTDLPATTHDVFIRRNGHEPRSHEVRVELVAGETTDVDLRAAAALQGLGGVRVLVRQSPEVRALLPRRRGVDVWVSDAATVASARGVSRSVRRVAVDGDVTTFERVGLVPGRHVVTVVPFGASREVHVRAGETTEVEIVLDDIGYVRFEPPTELAATSMSVDLDGSATGAALRSEFGLHVDAATSQPVVCGTYSARAVAHQEPWVSMDAIPLESDPFVVTRGATTTVPLRRRETVRVEVVAVDGTTGEPIGIDAAFWSRACIVDAATGMELCDELDLLGPRGAHTGAWCALEPREGLVRLMIPDSPFWTFEPLDAVELADGATITLRATAK